MSCEVHAQFCERLVGKFHRSTLLMLGLLIKGGAFLETKNAEESTPLHLAVSLNKKEYVEILLRSGVDVNTIGKSGCTPLHLAVMKGNKEIVELLLDRKANVYLECFHNANKGYTALEAAVANRNEKIIESFLLHGITLG